MRIGIVSPDPESTSGGVERYCHLLSESLTELGHNCSVIKWPIDSPHRFDLIITNGMIGGRTQGVSRIHIAHGCWVSLMLRGSIEASRRWRIRRLIQGAYAEMRAGRNAFRVAVSNSAADEWRKIYRLRCRAVIPSPVDTKRFRRGDKYSARQFLGLPVDRLIAVFVGRAEMGKCPSIATQASDLVGWTVVHAGSGTIPGSMPLGTVGGDQLLAAYHAADAMILPSRYEGCSLAILEALACGTPVVSSRIGWMKELAERIPGYDKLLAEPDDVSGFAQALRCSLNAEVDVTKASQYVRSHHDLDSFGNAWKQILEQFEEENFSR